MPYMKLSRTPSTAVMTSPTAKSKTATSKPSTTTTNVRKHSVSPPSSVGSSGYYHTQQNANRKRAKRQVAGGLVAGLFGGNTGASSSASQQGQAQGQPAQQQQTVKMTPSGKKSTAQPRPVVTVPPKGIGPVYNPNDEDVLCGRGGRINAHIGNQKFRVVVLTRKKEYLSPETKKLAKAHIAAEIVQQIRARGGRFLKEEANGAWFDIGDAKAIKKVGQALREDSQEARNHSDEDNAAGTPTISRKSIVAAPSSLNNNKTVSVALPQGATATTVPPVIPQPHPLVDQVSSTYEPLPFHPVPTETSTNNMGPPMAVLPGTGGSGGYRQQNSGNVISGAAAAAMRESAHDEFHHHHQGSNTTTGLAFDHVFHPTANAEGSAISGLTNDRSDLPGRNVLRASGHNTPAVFHHPQQPFRQVSPTRPASDLSGLSRPGLMRSASWVDGASFTEMSWAEHSLRGGGIPESSGASVLSGNRSIFSQMMRHNNPHSNNATDVDSIYEVLMQGSVASGSAGGGAAGFRRTSGTGSQQQQQLHVQQQLQQQHGLPYGQQLYRPVHVRHPQQAAAMIPAVPQYNISSGASVASMSIASQSLASLGSIKSIMSDLSETLVALDLAEPRMLGDL